MYRSRETPNQACSVVVPVYRSSSGLATLCNRIGTVLQNSDFEIILVDDGSPDDTWQHVINLVSQSRNVVGLRLGRNSGQHAALLAGIRTARYPIVVTLDDDLQNPPEEIPRLLACVRDGVDVVYGYPQVVSQSFWRRTAAVALRRSVAVASGFEGALKISSFRAFRTSLRDGFSTELGPGVSVDALLSWSTSSFRSIQVEHHPRRTGKSTYTLRRLFRFAADTITGYSTFPLQVASFLGVLTSIFGVLVLGYVLGRFFLTGSPVAGFPFLASTIAIFSGVQLLTLGLLGEYIARSHFRIMKKPTYFVAEILDRRDRDEL